jgi:hypothetical protein
MPVENASLGKVCASCGRNNASALKFCLTCGQQFGEDSVQVYGPDMSSPTFCKRCGIDDPYNEKFCIACGDALTVAVNLAELAEPGHRQATTRLKASFSKPGQPVFRFAAPQGSIASGALLLFMVCGAACGVGIAFLLKQHDVFSYFSSRLIWPRSGLVVYVKPSNCKATVSTLDRRRVFLARGDRHGNLKFGALTDGDYRLTITAPGYETVGQLVTVVSNRPTIIGYPDPITLPNRSPTEP